MVLKMVLKHILIPLQNIANISKRNGNVLMMHFQSIEKHSNKKTVQHTLFSLSRVFPNTVTNTGN